MRVEDPSQPARGWADPGPGQGLVLQGYPRRGAEAAEGRVGGAALRSICLWRDGGREGVRAVARVAAVRLHEERLECGAVVGESLVVAQEVTARDRRCGVVERRRRDLGFLPRRSAVVRD